MNVPARSAAAINISPLRAVTCRPSRVNVTCPSATSGGTVWAGSAVVARSTIGTAPLLDVDEELIPEHLDGRSDGRRDGGPQHADGGLLGWPGQPGGDVVADIEQEVEVVFPAVAGLDPLHDLLQPTGALPARRALPARLPGEELGDPPRRPNRTGVVVHHHNRAGPEHGARTGDFILAQGEVDLVGTEPGGRDTAGDERLQLPSVGNAPAEDRGVDEIAEGGLDH